MTKLISLDAFENSLVEKLAKLGFMLPEEEVEDIRAYAFYTSCYGLSKPCLVQWTSFVEHGEEKYELIIEHRTEPARFLFTVLQGEQSHKWAYETCYTEQDVGQLDSVVIDTSKVFEDITHALNDKSLYVYYTYKGDIDLITEEIQQLQDAAYSATHFLNAVINDSIYQESECVRFFSEMHTGVKYKFQTRMSKGTFIFDVIRNQEIAVIGYTLAFAGLTQPIRDISIIEL